jgi:hypothetical protein
MSESEVNERETFTQRNYGCRLTHSIAEIANALGDVLIIIIIMNYVIGFKISVKRLMRN